MATAETDLRHDYVIEPVVTNERCEARADGALSAAAMLGAVAGAVAGVMLGDTGSDAETSVPMLFGSLGTVFGSGLATAGWCLIVRLWAGISQRH